MSVYSMRCSNSSSMRLVAQRPDWAPNIGLRGKNPSGCYLVAFMGKSAGVEAIDVGSREMFEAMNKAIEFHASARWWIGSLVSPSCERPSTT